MHIDATKARIMGAQVGPVRLEIPNLGVEFPLLTVVGEAERHHQAVPGLRGPRAP